MSTLAPLPQEPPLLTRAGIVGLLFGIVGVVAFNLGSLQIYAAFLPLLCFGLLLFVEIEEDFFLPLLFFAAASTLLYSVGLFALPLVICSLLITAPLVSFLRRWLHFPFPLVSLDQHSWRRLTELVGLCCTALFARYLLYRSGGGKLPLWISEWEPLARFLVSEVVGWVVFSLGYGLHRQERVGTGDTASTHFSVNFFSLLATGLFLVSPHVGIMTLGLNNFGIAGLYVGTLPIGAAHALMRTLTLHRAEIGQQNLRLQKINIELARSERLAAIGQMSSAISHQILQKVGILGLQCDLLRDLFQDQTIPSETFFHEANERVEQLDTAVTDLNATLSDLLVFSRDFALHLDSHSLDTLLKETSREVQTIAAARGVAVMYRSGQVNEPLICDRIKLKQAILNVLKNAIEASPSSRPVEISLREEKGRILIAIKDYGTGIAPTSLDQIFAPFFSTKERGTGLGLPFAQKIVELHKGTLSARNNPEGGATFTIELLKQNPLHSSSL